jgi:hypothetical protein
MKKKINFGKILARIPLAILVVYVVSLCLYIYFYSFKGATYTKVTVVKDKSESCIFGYRWATVINKIGDSSDVLVNENLLFNKKLPFKAILKKSSRFDETFGIIRTNVWNKECWKSSFDVTVVEKTWSPYLDEVEVIAITKSGIKIKCSMNEKLFLSKKIPFSAKVINKIDGNIGYGFVIEE